MLWFRKVSQLKKYHIRDICEKLQELSVLKLDDNRIYTFAHDLLEMVNFERNDVSRWNEYRPYNFRFKMEINF